jgi:hypothetical protein
MKRFLIILFLSSVINANAFAENIFRCNAKDGLNKIEYLIKVDSEDITLNRALSDLSGETGKFDSTSEIYGFINKGEVIKFTNGKSEVFKLIVFNNAKIKDNSYFRAMYIKNSSGYMETHTIRITSWESNAPITIYSNYDNKLLKGTCK